MKPTFHPFLTLVVASGLAGHASADLVATDLNTGGTDTGFSGGWAGSVNRFIITAPDLTYPNYGITQTGTTQRVYGGNNSHPDRMDSRNLAAAMTGEIWFSVLVNAPEGGGFAGLSFHSDTIAQSTAYSHNLADLRVVMSPSELWVDWQGGSVNASWTPDATVGGFSAGTHLLVGRMVIGAGPDSLQVWVDPALVSGTGLAGLPDPTYSNATVDFTDSLVRIGVPLWINGLDTADSIRLSTNPDALLDVIGAPTVPGGDLELQWTNVTPNVGGDLWVDVWFGTDPGSLTQATAKQQNLTSITVNAPVAGTYYWRVDSYLDGDPDGTPVAGDLYSFVVNDTDGDGFPDEYELLHTDPPSNTALNREDDRDRDGINNWDEFQAGTNPSLADTDGDGLLDGDSITVGSADSRFTEWAADILFTDNAGQRTFRGENALGSDPLNPDTDGDGLPDGVETGTGAWVSATDTGTDPTNPDTDGDGLMDGVETQTGVFVSLSDTGTDPHNPDTDGDGAGDWYEIAASLTDPFDADDKPNVPYPLPDPDGSTGTTDKPVKVYIMSGQSNMVGFGTVSGTGDHTLETMTLRQNKFPNLIDEMGEWTTRPDVRYRGVISDIANAQLSPGALGATFGPELGFGYIMGWHHDEPVLLLKSCTGNRSLGWDVLPPGSPSYVYNDTNYAGYGDFGNWPVGGDPPTAGGWYAGKEFDRFFMDETEWAHPDSAVVNVVDVLDNWATEYPDWAGQGFEIAGFVWWQGDKDRYDMGLATRYEENLVNLINSLRDYYTNRYPGKVAANAPFVLATLGQTALDSTNTADKAILDAQLAVDGESGNYSQFVGNVKTVYAHPLSEGGASNGHYNGRAGTYLLVGDALGRAMVELLETSVSPGGDYDTWAAGYPDADLSDPSADLDGDGLSNNEERIWGLDPTRGDSANPITLPLDAAAGTLTYTRRNPALSGASFSYEWSSSLVDGSWTSFTPASEIGDGGSPVESVTITLNGTLLDEPRLFVRVVAIFN